MSGTQATMNMAATCQIQSSRLCLAQELPSCSSGSRSPSFSSPSPSSPPPSASSFPITQPLKTTSFRLERATGKRSFLSGESLRLQRSPRRGSAGSEIATGRDNDWRRAGLQVEAALNKNKDIVIVGGGTAAGYAARALVEKGQADGSVCIVTQENVPPYERPALTKSFLYPLEKRPAKLPGLYTCMGVGGERQSPQWYEEKGIEVLYRTTVTELDIDSQLLRTADGEEIEFKKLIIATGCSSVRLPESIGGSLNGVHYVRSMASAEAVAKDLDRAKKVVIIGGSYLGLECAAAAVAREIDTTVVMPTPHVMPRFFSGGISQHYEAFFREKGVKFIRGTIVKRILSGPEDDNSVAAVALHNGQMLDTDMVIAGIGAKAEVKPFLRAGLQAAGGGIEVNGNLRTSAEGIYAIGDVAAFPLQMIGGQHKRVEHVDNARKSAVHCIEHIVSGSSKPYDYLPFVYSRMFDYDGSERSLLWEFYGAKVGQVVQVGDFKPKLAAFWINGGRLRGVFLESGSEEEKKALPKLVRAQPLIKAETLQQAKTVSEALSIALLACDSPENVVNVTAQNIPPPKVATRR